MEDRERGKENHHRLIDRSINRWETTKSKPVMVEQDNHRDSDRKSLLFWSFYRISVRKPFKSSKRIQKGWFVFPPFLPNFCRVEIAEPRQVCLFLLKTPPRPRALLEIKLKTWNIFKRKMVFFYSKLWIIIVHSLARSLCLLVNKLDPMDSSFPNECN